MHREPGTLRRLLMDTGIWVWNVLNIWWLHGALYIQICENNYYIRKNECDDHHWKYQDDNIIMYRGLYWKIQKLRKKVHAHFCCVCVMFLYNVFVIQPVVFFSCEFVMETLLVNLVCSNIAVDIVQCKMLQLNCVQLK